MKRAIPTILILIVCAEAQAQTVADIARRERERRAAENSSGPAPVTVVGAGKPTATAPAPAPGPSPAAPIRPNVMTLTAARATTPADIGGRPDDVIRHYDIRGTTAAELRAEIARLGPVSDGVRHQAVTNWRLSWQPVTAVSGQRCSISSMNISLSIEIFMPRWVNEIGAQQGLSTNWRTFLTGLLNHEHGHKDIALAGADEVRALAKAAAPQSSCEAAVAALNAAGKAIVDKTVAKQRQYDLETNHGRNQGVRLP
jgi:predicted secreted Zn-dependent protease